MKVMLMDVPFSDRREAGRLLAQELNLYRNRQDVLVLGLPRGGVPVADEVARALGATLDVLVVRKLGVPGHPEYAMGAVAAGGVCFLDRQVVADIGIPEYMVEEVIEKETRELHRREHEYRGNRPMPTMSHRCVILVDDGLATGSTMRAAVEAMRKMAADRIVVAVPVGSPQTVDMLQAQADEVVCPVQPIHLTSVGQWYRDFSQITDAQVREILSRAATNLSSVPTR